MVADNLSVESGQKTVQVLSELITFKVSSEETGGAYSLVEAQTAPGGGVPPHLQHKDTETFYVLEGTYSFMKDGEHIEVGPGGTVFIGTGTVHAFQNNGATPARMLIINAPGGIHENFFKEIGVPVDDLENLPAVDMGEQVGRLLEIAPKYGIEMLPPAEAE